MTETDIMFVGENIPIKTKSKEISDSRRTELENLIKEVESSSLNVEQEALTDLKIEYQGYSELDPSFLGMGSRLEYKGREIQVPRFGVFQAKYDNNELKGFEIFAASYSVGDNGNIMFNVEKRANVDFGVLPKMITDNLAKSTEFFDHGKQNLLRRSRSLGENKYHFDNISDELYNKYPSGHDELSLTTRFSGLIPSETKEKLNEASTVFPGYGRIHLIAEVMPEEWTVVKVKKDPLLIGLHRDRMFLIDHFYTTSIEDYVRSEFLKD